MFNGKLRERVDALEDIVVDMRFEIKSLREELHRKSCCPCKDAAPKRRGRPRGSKNKKPAVKK